MGRFQEVWQDRKRALDLDRPGFESKVYLCLLQDVGHVIKLSVLICKTGNSYLEDPLQGPRIR